MIERAVAKVVSAPLAMVGSIATGVLAQVVLVISGVVLARTLGPENRGILALVLVLSAIATQIGSLGIPASVTYWIAAKEMTPRLLLRDLRAFRCVQLIVILGAQAGLIVVVLEPRSPPGFLWVGFLSLAATASGLSQMYGLAVLQGLRRFGAFNSVRILTGALYVVGVAGLWAIDQATLTSITIAVISASVIAAGLTWLIVLREGRLADGTGGSNEVAKRRVVSFGLRSLLGSSPPLETFRLDQLLIALLLSPVALGYYIVALGFTNLTRFIGQSIGMLTYPRVAAAGAGRSQLRIIRRDFALGVAVAGGTTLALIVAVPWLLPFFFGSAFTPAGAAAQILLVAAFFASLRRILIDGTRGTGLPMWGAAAELLTLIALPAVLIVTLYTDSLAAVALVLAGANLLGLLVVVPALLAVKQNPSSEAPIQSAPHYFHPSPSAVALASTRSAVVSSELADRAH
jgi:O-antigen/teichoic acid export membrane protein